MGTRLTLMSHQGESADCDLEFPIRRPWILEFRSDTLGELRAQEEDLFECLRQLRIELEKTGWFILCAGARTDVYPSPMSRQMGGGRQAYVQKIAHPARLDDLVDIFDPASHNDIGSVEEQAAYHEKWLASL